MGQKSSRGNEQVEISINHSKFVQSRVVKQGEKQILKTVIPCDEKAYKLWKEVIEKHKSMGHQYLMLPLKNKFKSSGVCATRGSLEMQFDNYPYLLTDEIYNRKGKKAPFTQPQLWYLLYAYLSVKKYLQTNIQAPYNLIGDIRPDNVFINQNGEVKFSCLFSWPGQKVNYKKTFDGITTYLSPQDYDLLNLGTMSNQANVSSQIFSIGLTLVSAATLRENSDIYNVDKLKFDSHQAKKRINTFKCLSIYSQLFRGIISSFCQFQAKNRLDLNDLWLWITKYERRIITKQPFMIEEIPPKINQHINRLRADIITLQPSSSVLNLTSIRSLKSSQAKVQGMSQIQQQRSNIKYLKQTEDKLSQSQIQTQKRKSRIVINSGEQHKKVFYSPNGAYFISKVGQGSKNTQQLNSQIINQNNKIQSYQGSYRPVVNAVSPQYEAINRVRSPETYHTYQQQRTQLNAYYRPVLNAGSPQYEGQKVMKSPEGYYSPKSGVNKFRVFIQYKSPAKPIEKPYAQTIYINKQGQQTSVMKVQSMENTQTKRKNSDSQSQKSGKSGGSNRQNRFIQQTLREEQQKRQQVLRIKQEEIKKNNQNRVEEQQRVYKKQSPIHQIINMENVNQAISQVISEQVLMTKMQKKNHNEQEQNKIGLKDQLKQSEDLLDLNTSLHQEVINQQQQQKVETRVESVQPNVIQQQKQYKVDQSKNQLRLKIQQEINKLTFDDGQNKVVPQQNNKQQIQVVKEQRNDVKQQRNQEDEQMNQEDKDINKSQIQKKVQHFEQIVDDIYPVALHSIQQQQANPIFQNIPQQQQIVKLQEENNTKQQQLNKQTQPLNIQIVSHQQIQYQTPSNDRVQNEFQSGTNQQVHIQNNYTAQQLIENQISSQKQPQDLHSINNKSYHSQTNNQSNIIVTNHSTNQNNNILIQDQPIVEEEQLNQNQQLSNKEQQNIKNTQQLQHVALTQQVPPVIIEDRPLIPLGPQIHKQHKHNYYINNDQYKKSVEQVQQTVGIPQIQQQKQQIPQNLQQQQQRATPVQHQEQNKVLSPFEQMKVLSPFEQIQRQQQKNIKNQLQGQHNIIYQQQLQSQQPQQSGFHSSLIAQRIQIQPVKVQIEQVDLGQESVNEDNINVQLNNQPLINNQLDVMLVINNVENQLKSSIHQQISNISINNDNQYQNPIETQQQYQPQQLQQQPKEQQQQPKDQEQQQQELPQNQQQQQQMDIKISYNVIQVQQSQQPLPNDVQKDSQIQGSGKTHSIIQPSNTIPQNHNQSQTQLIHNKSQPQQINYDLQLLKYDLLNTNNNLILNIEQIVNQKVIIKPKQHIQQSILKNSNTQTQRQLKFHFQDSFLKQVQQTNQQLKHMQDMKKQNIEEIKENKNKDRQGDKEDNNKDRQEDKQDKIQVYDQNSIDLLQSVAKQQLREQQIKDNTIQQVKQVTQQLTINNQQQQQQQQQQQFNNLQNIPIQRLQQPVYIIQQSNQPQQSQYKIVVQNTIQPNHEQQTKQNNKGILPLQSNQKHQIHLSQYQLPQHNQQKQQHQQKQLHQQQQLDQHQQQLPQQINQDQLIEANNNLQVTYQQQPQLQSEFGNLSQIMDINKVFNNTLNPKQNHIIQGNNLLSATYDGKNDQMLKQLMNLSQKGLIQQKDLTKVYMSNQDKNKLTQFMKKWQNYNPNQQQENDLHNHQQQNDLHNHYIQQFRQAIINQLEEDKKQQQLPQEERVYMSEQDKQKLRSIVQRLNKNNKNLFQQLQHRILANYDQSHVDIKCSQMKTQIIQKNQDIKQNTNQQQTHQKIQEQQNNKILTRSNKITGDIIDQVIQINNSLNKIKQLTQNYNEHEGVPLNEHQIVALNEHQVVALKQQIQNNINIQQQSQQLSLQTNPPTDQLILQQPVIKLMSIKKHNPSQLIDQLHSFNPNIDGINQPIQDIQPFIIDQNIQNIQFNSNHDSHVHASIGQKSQRDDLNQDPHIFRSNQHDSTLHDLHILTNHRTQSQPIDVFQRGTLSQDLSPRSNKQARNLQNKDTITQEFIQNQQLTDMLPDQGFIYQSQNYADSSNIQPFTLKQKDIIDEITEINHMITTQNQNFIDEPISQVKEIKVEDVPLVVNQPQPVIVKVQQVPVPRRRVTRQNDFLDEVMQVNKIINNQEDKDYYKNNKFLSEQRSNQ